MFQVEIPQQYLAFHSVNERITEEDVSEHVLVPLPLSRQAGSKTGMAPTPRPVLNAISNERIRNPHRSRWAGHPEAPLGPPQPTSLVPSETIQSPAAHKKGAPTALDSRPDFVPMKSTPSVPPT